MLLLNMRDLVHWFWKKWSQKEIYQEIQKLDCYDDVSEDDDMIVIE